MLHSPPAPIRAVSCDPQNIVAGYYVGVVMDLTSEILSKTLKGYFLHKSKGGHIL